MLTMKAFADADVVVDFLFVAVHLMMSVSLLAIQPPLIISSASILLVLHFNDVAVAQCTTTLLSLMISMLGFALLKITCLKLIMKTVTMGLAGP